MWILPRKTFCCTCTLERSNLNPVSNQKSHQGVGCPQNYWPADSCTFLPFLCPAQDLRKTLLFFQEVTTEHSLWILKFAQAELLWNVNVLKRDFTSKSQKASNSVKTFRLHSKICNCKCEYSTQECFWEKKLYPREMFGGGGLPVPIESTTFSSGSQWFCVQFLEVWSICRSPHRKRLRWQCMEWTIVRLLLVNVQWRTLQNICSEQFTSERPCRGGNLSHSGLGLLTRNKHFAPEFGEEQPDLLLWCFLTQRMIPRHDDSLLELFSFWTPLPLKITLVRWINHREL